MRVIDTHAHIVDTGQHTYPPHSAEHLLRCMDDSGVDRAVLVQYSAAHGYDNRYVLDAAERYPGRFVAVCTPDPNAAHVSDIRGAAGLRVRAPDRGPSLDWLAGSGPVWRRAADLGIPVAVHLQQQHHAAAIPVLRGLLDEFHTVDVVLDHVGNPAWESTPRRFGLGLVETLADHERLVLKFATLNLNRLEAAGVQPLLALRRLIAVFGSNRLMWGSDVPNTPGDYKQMVWRMLEHLSQVAVEDRDNILSNTAMRVYPTLARNQEKEAADARLSVT
jgi:L-fuconolactonase